jgi:4-hydroxyphenylpyruvate dioxygenase-like putative hemolysin
VTHVLEHEAVPEEGSNPLGISGIEFIEFATSKPQALGVLLEKWDFVRSRGTAPGKSNSIGRVR